jgi:hypothetical protein
MNKQVLLPKALFLKVHSHLVFKDSSIKSPNTKLGSHLGPKPIYHEDFMLTFI